MSEDWDYVFVGLDTETIETVSPQSRLVWIGNIDPRDLTGDDYFDDETMIELAGYRGVPLYDIISAWEWRESLARVGILDGVFDYIARTVEDQADRVS